MQHIWSVICQQSIIDAQSNNISLINVTERLVFSLDKATEFQIREQLDGNLPIPISVHLVTMWSRTSFDEPEAQQSRVLLLFPNGEERELAIKEVDLSMHVRSRSIIRVNGVDYIGDGFYRFIVQLNENDEWHTTADIPLEIIYEPKEESET